MILPSAPILMAAKFQNQFKMFVYGSDVGESSTSMIEGDKPSSTKVHGTKIRFTWL